MERSGKYDFLAGKSSSASCRPLLRCLCLILLACTSEVKTVGPQPNEEQARQADILIGIDSKFVDSITSDVPLEHRDQARRMLADYLAEIRANPPAALSAEEERVRRKAWEKEAKDKRGLIPVTVAIVPNLRPSNARASVLRAPGDEGRPILLLREGDATDEDLRRGLRAAGETVERFGDSVPRRLRLNVRPRGRNEPVLSPRRQGSKSPLELMNLMVPREIQGFGSVRAMEMMAHLPHWKKPKSGGT